MDAFPQLPLSDDLFLNGERRLPCVILADRSYSMNGHKIDRLNEGLKHFERAVSQDMMALKRVETEIISFGPVHVQQEFDTMDRITMPVLTADEDTPMGEAIETALDRIKKRQADYQAAKVPSYKPWIFLITDGAPTDDTSRAAQLVRDREAKQKLNFFSIGVDGADFGALKKFSSRPPIALENNDFEALFEFMTVVMTTVAKTRPGDQIDLPPPESTGVMRVVA